MNILEGVTNMNIFDKYSELVDKEEEGTITEEEQSDLDFINWVEEQEMYQDLMYMRLGV